ncbi:hypothetical protein ACFL1H_03965 [Nanoarchaeota archaeon]
MRYTNKTILVFILIVLTLNITFAVQNYYKIDLFYDNGNITMQDMIITPYVSNHDYESQSGGYHAQVIDYNYNIIDIAFFTIPLIILWDQVDEQGNIVGGNILKLNQTEFSIYVPYHETAEQILFYDPNIKETYRINVGKVAKNKTIIEKPTGIIGEADAEEKLSELLQQQRKTERKVDILSYVGLFLVLLILFIITIHELKRRKHV